MNSWEKGGKDVNIQLCLLAPLGEKSGFRLERKARCTMYVNVINSETIKSVLEEYLN